VLFEAVPNFSEGRDEEKISRITEAVRAVPGVRILGLHSDQDHNRSVLTFAGEEDDVLAGAMALAKACAAELDLAAQTGEHPRMGVLDVLPFVPLDPATMDDAVRLARRAGELLGALGFPVYLYGAAATAAHRRDLPDVRRGGYEGLASRVEDPRWRPDFGPAELDPRAGAVAVGARPFLVAFNAYLDTQDVEVARAIASEVRERDGGLPAVRALGLEVGERAQVSMNLTDLRKTSIPVALETVRAAAAERGAAVESTELVGLAPLEAILETARHYLGLRGLEAEHVLEMRLCDTLLHDGASGRNRRC
jgi:glutamate formiminotransferase / 5-formyltetrahydrofolate cyclo-ligase